MSKKPFTVYFVPMAHHDLGYTQCIDDLLHSYCGYYDTVLDFCDRTADYPYEAQYRYSIEEFWSLDHYLRKTTLKNRERLISYIRQGRIELPALYANVIDGICSEEELARLMYPSFAFAREAGVNIRTASLTDMPGMSDAAIYSLAKAGVEYLFAGFPQYFRWADATGKVPVMKHSYWKENIVSWGHPAAFSWQAMAGGQVLTWYQDGYGWFGDDTSALVAHDTYEEIEDHLPRFLQEMKQKGVPYHVMRYIDHGSDNEAPRIGISDIVRRWNKKHDDIKLIVATNTMFFDALKADLEEMTIPVLRGHMPHTDYAVLSLTEAKISALNAHTKQRAANAEKMLALAGQRAQTLCDEIYRSAILFDEHCYGMSRPYGYQHEYNRSLKINYAFDAARKTDLLWERAAATVTELNGTYTLFSPFPGKGIASEIAAGERNGYQHQNSMILRNGSQRIMIQRDKADNAYLPIYNIENVHAMALPGNDVYEYTAAVEASSLSLSSYVISEEEIPDNGALITDTVWENAFYRITFDPKHFAITAIFDKELGCDITDGVFGNVITRDIRNNTCHISQASGMYHRKTGPVADSMVICSRVYAAPAITAEITLYHTLKRIDIAYRITLDSTPQKEIFIEFPFCAEHPDFLYQNGGLRINAFSDIVPGGNTNHHAVSDYCLIQSPHAGIVLAASEARLFEFGGMHPTAVSQAHHQISPQGFTDSFITRDDIDNAHIYSMIAYNNCRTNFSVVQQGDVICRYAITSGKHPDADQFAASFTGEPVLLPGICASASIDTGIDTVLPVCFKAAEDGDGWILRLRETSGKESIAVLSCTGRDIQTVGRCTLTEEKEVLLPYTDLSHPSLSLHPYETVTLRLRFRE